MDQEIDLILKRLNGTSLSKPKELIGFSSEAIAKLISSNLIARTKEREIAGSFWKYYLL